MTTAENLEFRRNVYNTVHNLLKSEFEALSVNAAELRESINEETKSSAGDKYETGRAMGEIELEKVSAQLREKAAVIELLRRIDPAKPPASVSFGSVVRTTLGIYFVSVNARAVNVDDLKIVSISPAAPLGKMLLGKKAGDSFVLNNATHQVQEIF